MKAFVVTVLEVGIISGVLMSLVFEDCTIVRLGRNANMYIGCVRQRLRRRHRTDLITISNVEVPFSQKDLFVFSIPF
jgi:hypothetical protein